jgi:hypothetical protein
MLQVVLASSRDPVMKIIATSSAIVTALCSERVGGGHYLGHSEPSTPSARAIANGPQSAPLRVIRKGACIQALA